MSRITGDRPTTLAMPNQKHSPHNLGIKCGRRERESRREGRREQSLRGKSIPSRVVTVKGILIFWKAARFAVCCRREGLGRSVIRVAVSPATQSRADDSECPEGCRGGERRRHAPQSVCTRRTRKRTLTHAKKRGRVLHSVLRPVHVNPRYSIHGASCEYAGRTSRHHGWAKLGQPGKNQHWGRHERTKRGSPHLTASAMERA